MLYHGLWGAISMKYCKNQKKGVGSGCSFTWKNNRVEGFIEEKLDRVVANDEWFSLFPSAFYENLSWDGSDHIPIVLFFHDHSGEDKNKSREGSNMFRFEARWMQHGDFDSCVSNSWDLAKS